MAKSKISGMGSVSILFRETVFVPKAIATNLDYADK
jgi:hypothetical protein